MAVPFAPPLPPRNLHSPFAPLVLPLAPNRETVWSVRLHLRYNVRYVRQRKTRVPVVTGTQSPRVSVRCVYLN